MASIIVGVGHLTWEMIERRSGRYGTVYLTHPTESGDGGASAQDDSDVNGFVKMPMDIRGYGKLTARVISPRESDHVGDQIRGFYPSLPNENEEIILGEGMAYYDEGIGGVACFGVQPLDGRHQFWLSPESVFRCHSSVVELSWEPMEQPTAVKQVKRPEGRTFTQYNNGREGYIQVAYD